MVIIVGRETNETIWVYSLILWLANRSKHVEGGGDLAFTQILVSNLEEI